MKIELFKDGLFESLKKYNQEIITVCDRHKINKFGEGNDSKSSCWWFNPREIQKLHLTTTWKERGEIVFPEPNPIVYEKKFCLILYVPNYLALFLVNKLFSGRDILFEDLGSGLSQVSFYLMKCGFNNFSFVENFANLTPDLFLDFVQSTKMNYTLNNPNTEPVVTNIVGHHPYPKKITPSTELFCTYVKDELVDMFEKLEGYKFLCEDSDGLSRAYARIDKYDEFKEKLKDYRVD